MTRISWGDSGTRFFEAGVDRGVLYLSDNSGVVWNGLRSVKEAPSGAEISIKYIDGEPYNSGRAQEGFAATIEAYTYPQEFEEYDGLSDLVTGQVRKAFNFSYRTLVGNDVDGLDAGYKIHIVYNALAKPSGAAYATQDDGNEATAFSWDISTTPIRVADGRHSSHVVIDTRVAYPGTIQQLEDVLYGSDGLDSMLPSIDDILAIFENNAILKITDNGDGTWTAEGPDSAISMLDDKTFEITWPSAVYIDTELYQISSL